jgi:hypothetical protein
MSPPAGLRWPVLAFCWAVLIAVFFASAVHAFNLYQDVFVTLAARPLSMGGAAAAVPDPSSVFSNPACLAVLRSLHLLYNHSARHFPGSKAGGQSEWDQLDGDTEAIVVPLPLCTYAHGFTLSGEMGYDYSGHPPGGLYGYLREQVWGTEEYDALAFGSGLPVAAGAALRRNLQRFTPAQGSASPAWLRLGEGQQFGVYLRPAPGLHYGYSDLKLDYDWTVLGKPAQGEADSAGFPTFNSRFKQKRSGWSFQPCGWIILAQDAVLDTYSSDGKASIGVIRGGRQQRSSLHRGVEVQLGNGVALRAGSYDGRPTSGLALKLGGLWLNYAEAQDLLPAIVGAGNSFKDVHIYGFDWSL